MCIIVMPVAAGTKIRPGQFVIGSFFAHRAGYLALGTEVSDRITDVFGSHPSVGSNPWGRAEVNSPSARPAILGLDPLGIGLQAGWIADATLGARPAFFSLRCLAAAEVRQSAARCRSTREQELQN